MHNILLDRSIFHGAKFDQLRSSELLNRSRQNEVRIYYTPRFLEETLRYIADQRAGSREQWIFLCLLNSTRWFRDAKSIVAAELSNSVLVNRYYMRTADEIQAQIAGVNSFFENGIDQNRYQQALAQAITIEHQRRELRNSLVELRKKEHTESRNFDQYCQDTIEWFIENNIMKHYADSGDYLKNWKANKTRCKFTESFTRAWLAVVYGPLADRSLRVDKNDRADAEQLAYLRWADIMVSDDTRFMKSCFDLLYQSSGKKLFTLSDSIKFLDQLA